MTRLLPAVLIASIVVPALAHDLLGNANWISKGHYTSPIDGAHCCGVNDCKLLEAENIEQRRDGSYLLLLSGELIPAREVQISKDGNFWRCHKPNGHRRCFFAPPSST